MDWHFFLWLCATSMLLGPLILLILLWLSKNGFVEDYLPSIYSSYISVPCFFQQPLVPMTLFYSFGLQHVILTHSCVVTHARFILGWLSRIPESSGHPPLLRNLRPGRHSAQQGHVTCCNACFISASNVWIAISNFLEPASALLQSYCDNNADQQMSKIWMQMPTLEGLEHGFPSRLCSRLLTRCLSIYATFAEIGKLGIRIAVFTVHDVGRYKRYAQALRCSQ